jgi:hypothetical protein
MRFTFLIVSVLAIGVSARRKAPLVEPSGGRRRHVPVIGEAHFGWGMPMDERPEEPEVKEVSVSNKKTKNEQKLPECTDFHRRWHLPCCEHCSDVDKAFDGLE